MAHGELKLNTTTVSPDATRVAFAGIPVGRYRLAVDPLMGWTSSSDMNGQVRMNFDSKEEAVEYAERHGIAFRLHEPNDPPVIIKAYADNFATNRKQSWTH